jgi:hypothetical protein
MARDPIARDRLGGRSILPTMRYRRAALRALVISVLTAAWYGWMVSPGASIGERIVTGVILFVVLFALALIGDVGGAMLADERARNRRTPPIDSR